MTNKKMGHGEAAPLVINFIKRSLVSNESTIAITCVILINAPNTLTI